MDELSFPITRPRADERPSPAVANAPLYVSLFLFLLVFFILMHSMSVRDAKKFERVAASLGDVFSVAPPVTIIQQEKGTPATIAQFFGEVRGALGALSPEALPAPQGMQWRASFPARLLFNDNSASWRGENVKALDAFVATLLDWHDVLPLEVDCALDYDTGRDAEAVEASRRLAIMRAAAMAQGLAARGLPAEKIATGLKPGAAGELALTVRIQGRQDKAALPSTLRGPL